MSEERDLSLRLALLDSQVVDCDRLPIGRVDDIELAVDSGAPEISRILVGAEPLGERIGGLLGRWMSATSRRLRGAGSARLPGFDPALIVEVEPMIRLSAGFDELPELAGLERWLRSRFVERLPGTGDASE